jgi:uncharacterized membrane protein
VELNSELFSRDFHILLALLYGGALLFALRIARWRWILNTQRIHVFLGATLILGLLWHVRAQAEPVVALHLIGVTTITLMFGWAQAIIASTLAMVFLTANGRAEWEMFAFNGLINGVIPATISQLSLLALRTWLPRNFFIYVLGNGFFTAGLSVVAATLCGGALLVLGGVFSYGEIAQVYLPFLPLLFFPEAFLNGWIVTILVCFKPHWIYSFSDEHYIHGK